MRFRSTLGKDSHETEHFVIDEMRTDSAYHEKRAPLGKMYCFNTVLRYGLRIEAPVYPLIGVVNQQGKKWIRGHRIDVGRLSSIIIDEYLAKAANDEVDRSASLDRDLMRCELVMVAVNRIGVVRCIWRIRG